MSFDLNFSIEVVPSLIACFANCPGSIICNVLSISFTEIVFFPAISVRSLTFLDMIFVIIQRALLSCCFALEVIPLFFEICFKTLEINVSKKRLLFLFVIIFGC